MRMPGRYDEHDEDFPRRKNNGQKSVVKKKTAGGQGRSVQSSSAKRETPPKKTANDKAGEQHTKKKPTGTQQKTGAQSKTRKPQTTQTKNRPQEKKKPAVPKTNKKGPAGSQLKEDAIPKRAKSAKSKVTSKKPAPEKKKPVKRAKAKSRSKAKIATILTYVFVIAAFLAVMVVLALTVFFKVDKITLDVSGTSLYSREEMLAAGEIDEGGSILSISSEDTQQRIEKALPYIAECKVVKNMPNEIRLEVLMAKPGGIVTDDEGKRFIISDFGKVMEKLAPVDSSATDAYVPEERIPDDEELSESDASASDMSYTDIMPEPETLRLHSAFVDDTSLTEIRGLAISDTDIGEILITADETSFTTLKNLTALLSAHGLTPNWIDLSPGNLYVRCEDRMTIKLGSGNQLEEKIKRAGEIITNRLTIYDSGQIDVTNPSKTYYTPSYIHQGD